MNTDPLQPLSQDLIDILMLWTSMTGNLIAPAAQQGWSPIEAIVHVMNMDIAEASALAKHTNTMHP